MNYKTIIILSFTFLVIKSFSQIPSGYYDNVEGLTGEELKAGLHNIIKDHVEFSYDDLRDFILRNTDEDPENSNNVILLYSGRSQDKNTFGGDPNDWNREHVWAKSHGDFGNNPPAGTDAHHIRPTDVSVNSSRGNLDFDIGGSPVNEAPGCYKDGDSFEPRDEVKGDVARMIFYMAVRYEGGSGEPDLEVVDAVNTSPNPEHGKLSQLLLWNTQDPPDDFEMNRNDVIYYQYQQNRNPFIDHPEYVDQIWGDPSFVDDHNKLNVSIFPIPSNNILNISGQNIKGANYRIFSVDGRLVDNGNIEQKTTKISINHLPDGIYQLVIINSESYSISKFIKSTQH